MLPGERTATTVREAPVAPVMTGSALLAGGAWSVLSRVIPQAQLLALSIITARALGPEDMGRQSYIAFIALSLVMVATAGLPGSLTRFTAELLGGGSGGRALGVLRLTVRIEAAAAVAAGAGLAAIGIAGAEPRGAWILAGASAALFILASPLQALLTGAQRWREAIAPGLVTGILAIPVTYLVLAAGGGIAGVFAVETGVAALNLAAAVWLSRRLARRMPSAGPVPGDLRRRFATFAAVSTLLILVQYVVARRSELFVMDAVSSDAQIAFYSIGFAIAAGLAAIPDAVGKVAMPAVATLAGAAQHARIRAGFWRAVRLLVAVSPPLAVAAIVTGPALLAAVYGDDYRAAGDALRVLLAPLMLLPLLMLAQAVLFALGRLGVLVGVNLAATAVDIGLALALIPSLDAVGAAIANVAAQLVAGVPCLIVAARMQAPVDVDWAAAGRTLGLTAAVGVGVALPLATIGDGPGGLAASLAVGALVLVAAWPWARPLAGRDAAWLAAAVGGRRRSATVAGAGAEGGA